MVRLEEIGFYTLSESRAEQASETSPLWRCELVLTARCNFRCPYCRHVGGKDIRTSSAMRTLRLWVGNGLKNVRFSGGEPTLYGDLPLLVAMARRWKMDRIAVSTNGSASRELYQTLINLGVNDFSVSLDACCAEDGDKMAGGIKGAWNTVVENIRFLSSQVYTTVGVVLTATNAHTINDICRVADRLGVHDIRVIPAAQYGERLPEFHLDASLRARYPILRYRWNNVRAQGKVRGLDATDVNRCGLAVDDMAVMGDKHYPCIIYMREGGAPIGDVGPDMRRERAAWSAEHDTHADPICQKNCLDVCVHYNNAYAYHRGRLG
jgi:MoaA/NifB/PqqE/SkfB family radical SAM enzyme